MHPSHVLCCCSQVCMLKQVTESCLQQVRQCCMQGFGLTTRLLPSSRSTLFPSTTNGKFSGSDGLAYMAITPSCWQIQR